MNELIVDFRRQQREHAPSTSTGQQWRRWKASSSSAYTSLTIWNGPPTQTVWWRRRNSACSTSGGWRNLSWRLRPSQTFTDTQLRAYCRAVSPPNMATAPTATAGVSRGWCGLPSASPGAQCLPSRTPSAPDVTGRPKRSSRTSTTPLPSRRRGQYGCIKAWTERLINSFYQTVKWSSDW